MNTEKSKYQKFKIVSIDRADIKNAPYNPRKIKKKNKTKLEKYIKKAGLLQPIIYNRLTGNIVSGHQRISILDSLENTKEYSIDVAEVEMSESAEKEANIQINNQNLMGEFEYGNLKNLIVGIDMDFRDFGFDLSVDIADFPFSFDDGISDSGNEIEQNDSEKKVILYFSKNEYEIFINAKKQSGIDKSEGFVIDLIRKRG